MFIQPKEVIYGASENLIKKISSTLKREELLNILSWSPEWGLQVFNRKPFLQHMT